MSIVDRIKLTVYQLYSLGVVILVDSDLCCGFREAVGGGIKSLKAVKLEGMCISTVSC